MPKVSLYFFITFYLVAGIMHFITPEVYLEVIPDQLGDALILNYAAGAAEIMIAMLAVFRKTRKFSGYGAIAMLLVFVISHVYFIQLGGCSGDLCIPEWIGWVRLLLIHPLLLYWAYTVTKNKTEIL